MAQPDPLASRQPPPVVTIAAPYGSGSAVVGCRVAERWACRSWTGTSSPPSPS